MQWSEMNHAVNEARAIIDRADLFVAQMARLIAGKLKSGDVSAWTLTELKKELRDFDMRSGDWKE